jgi:hypothetical protein
MTEFSHRLPPVDSGEPANPQTANRLIILAIIVVIVNRLPQILGY